MLISTFIKNNTNNDDILLVYLRLNILSNVCVFCLYKIIMFDKLSVNCMMRHPVQHNYLNENTTFIDLFYDHVYVYNYLKPTVTFNSSQSKN